MRFMFVHCQVLVENNDGGWFPDDHYGVFIAKKNVGKGTLSIELHEPYLSFDKEVMKVAMFQLAQKLFCDEESCEVKCHHHYPGNKSRSKIAKGECLTMHRGMDQPKGCPDYRDCAP